MKQLVTERRQKRENAAGTPTGTALRRSEHHQAQHHANTLPEPASKHPKRLYVGMDGVFVPLRDVFKHDKRLAYLVSRRTTNVTAHLPRFPKNAMPQPQ